MPRKLLIGGAIILTAGALVAVNLLFTRSDAPEVEVEAIARRPLEAIVSAPGTIEPQLSVDMSASTMGRVTSLAVDEGDRVAAGEFLLQIDPENLQAQVTRGVAVLEAAESAYRSAQVAVETARVNLDLAEENLERQENLWSLRLVAREIYDQAVADVELRETELRAREVDVEAAAQRIRQEQATLDSARYDLTQVTITSPIDGIVTRRNIEEGETVVIGTMNNAGTVLLTIADFSILEAEIEVDETDIPTVQLGQEALITIDALPAAVHRPRDRDRQQSDPGRGRKRATGGDQLPGRRDARRRRARRAPGLHLHGRDHDGDANRRPVGADPGDDGPGRHDRLGRQHRAAGAAGRLGRPLDAGVRGSSDGSGAREEREGVFTVRQGRVRFTPVVTGIAGERYFEALSGLNEGDMVVTGPFEVVRNLVDGDAVDVAER